MHLFSRPIRSPIASRSTFREMYERNRLPVFRYIYGLTGGPQENVEDLTAETFLRAWKARHQFEGSADSATGWLIRIAKRLVIDDYRRTQQETHYSSMEDSGEPTPEQIAVTDEQKSLILALVASLPDESREIMVLRYLLGWRVNDIASYLGTTENNISVTIHRTLSRLREKWIEADSESLSAAFTQEEKSS